MSEPEQISVSKFEKALHDRSAFSCGITSIDGWFKTGISDQIKDGRIQVYCATAPSGAIVGFYALNAHSVKADQAGFLARRRERHEIPTVYLPCIAVHQDWQKKGIGSLLMGDAIKRSVEVSSVIGAAALVLDVKLDEHFERRMRFYTDLGFAPLGGTEERRIYLPLKVAAASLAAAEMQLASTL